MKKETRKNNQSCWLLRNKLEHGTINKNKTMLKQERLNIPNKKQKWMVQ